MGIFLKMLFNRVIVEIIVEVGSHLFRKRLKVKKEVDLLYDELKAEFGEE